jgi:glycine cleavage system aminomethyltransferase T
MRLTSAESKGKDAGWVTSATRSEKIGRHIGLAYVKRGFNDPGVKLAAASPSGGALEELAPENARAGTAIPVQVVSLPFV